MVIGLTRPTSQTHVVPRESNYQKHSVFLWLLDTLLAYGILYSEPRASSGRYRASIGHKNTFLIMRQYLTTKTVTMQYTLIIHCIHEMDGFGIGISPRPEPYLEAEIEFCVTVNFKQHVLCLVLELEKV